MFYIVILCITFLSSVGCTQARERYGKEEINSISSMGSVQLTGTHVLGSLSSLGSATLKNAHIDGNVAIAGSLDATNTQLKKSTNVSGSADVDDSVFESTLSVSGSLRARNLKGQSIHVGGRATLKSSDIEGDASIGGSLVATDTECNALVVSGSAEMSKVTVKGSATISGHFESEGSNFQDELFLASRKAILDSTTTQAITISKISKCSGSQVRNARINNVYIYDNVYFTDGNKIHCDGQDCHVLEEDLSNECVLAEQVVELRNDTKVNGPITFESGKGKVIVDATSSFTEVIGGTIERS